jgi:hypothetical protein
MITARKQQLWPALAIFLCLAAPAAASVEGRFERTLTVGGPVSLSVTSGSGSVKVTSGPDGAIHVIGVIRGNSWWNSSSSDELERAVKTVETKPPIVQDGASIRIGEIADERIGRLVSISYTISVPRHTSVESNTGSGSQSIAALSGRIGAASGSGSIDIGTIDGKVDARTGSGSINIEGATGGLSATSGSGSIKIGTTAGDMRVRSGSGSISIRQVASDAADISSSSGQIDVTDLKGGLKVTSSSASIDVSGTPTADWTASSSSGSITLNIPANTSFRLRANSSSGSIHTDHTITPTTVGRHEMVGTAGSGGVLIDAHSTSGSIIVGRR